MRLPFILALPALTMLACSNGTQDNDASGSDDVVGVTDLAAMESSLDLSKDQKDAQGHWTRGDELLANGPCYKRTISGSEGASWEFRRYVNGAAFFKKLGTAPATGNARPVTCVDVDVQVGGKRSTNAISGVVLDAALRYKLGKGWHRTTDDGGVDFGGIHGIPRAYMTFDRGSFDVADPTLYCDTHLPGVHADEPAPLASPTDPAIVGAEALLGQCVAGGSDMAQCWERARNKCIDIADADTGADDLARPSYDGQYIYELAVKDAAGNASYIQPQVMSFAYRFAWKSANRTNVFDEASDPVGAFVKVEEIDGPPGSGAKIHVRFGKLDVHRIVAHPDANGNLLDQLFVTPKNSDATIASSALAKCSRTITAKASPSYTCTGI